MAYTVTGLEREFHFSQNGNKVALTDPDPGRAPEQVMMFYSNQYPFLTTATVHGPDIQKGKAVYEFKTVLGTKG